MSLLVATWIARRSAFALDAPSVTVNLRMRLPHRARVGHGGLFVPKPNPRAVTVGNTAANLTRCRPAAVTSGDRPTLAAAAGFSVIGALAAMTVRGACRPADAQAVPAAPAATSQPSSDPAGTLLAPRAGGRGRPRNTGGQTAQVSTSPAPLSRPVPRTVWRSPWPTSATVPSSPGRPGPPGTRSGRPARPA